MPAKKYHQDRSPCPLAGALDIVGDRWTLLVIRDLMFTDRHEFKDILQAPEGISTNILTARLRRLCQDGLITSSPHPDSKRRKLYHLTEKGKSLFPVLAALSHWQLQGRDISGAPPHLQLIAQGNLKKAQQVAMERLKKWERENLEGNLG